MNGLLIASLTFNVIQLVFAFWMNNSWYKKMQELNQDWYQHAMDGIKRMSESGEEQNENQTDGMLHAGDQRN